MWRQWRADKCSVEHLCFLPLLSWFPSISEWFIRDQGYLDEIRKSGESKENAAVVTRVLYWTVAMDWWIPAERVEAIWKPTSLTATRVKVPSCA